MNLYRVYNLSSGPQEKDRSVSDNSSKTSKQSETAMPQAGDIILGRYRLKRKILEDKFQTYYIAIDQAVKGNVVLVFPSSLDSGASFGHFLEFYRSSSLVQDGIFLYSSMETMEPSDEIGDGDSNSERLPFIVRDYRNTVRLNEIVSSSGPVESEEQAVSLISQVCKALQHAHDNGVVHGDLTPDKVLLRSGEGEQIVVQVDDFSPRGKLSSSSEESRKLEDIFRLGLLTYYVVSGIYPTCKDNQLVSELESISSVRGELSCQDEFLWLLEDATSFDRNARVQSVGEFEDGLLDWLEAVKSTAKSEALPRAGGVLSDSVSAKESIETPTTRDLSSAVKHLTDLRKRQTAQEESMVIKLTDLASSGPRKSPTVTAGKVSLIALVWLVLVGGVYLAYTNNPEPFETGWRNSSRAIYAALHPGQPQEPDDAIDQVGPFFKSGENSTGRIAAQGNGHSKEGSPSRQTNDHRGRANRLPPFNSSSLRDIYQGKARTRNNEKSRAGGFRIEYREFKEEWIK